MYAIITTTGPDRVGIIAGVSKAVADHGLNIVDVSQTIMDDFFTMVLRAELPSEGFDLAGMQDDMIELGKGLGVDIRVQSEALFTAMNEV
ncbi:MULTISPECIES: ACT domain-containing protein [unclassified Corynebacterium]|uniref:ACT domain-containing protein n=1 Tax=unclassified Corynebacterium TaxID=2624378 RepID=UPI0021AA667C|nr:MULTISPECIES: ACT domain-containing protein [unclassified Corynebacterium]MCT1452419.1 ACT domain-containing protein [Corynebacterium sp. p3-SID1145]MCT1461185.1 ACT domain-containing protein [Corynebacterium sp. p3-SID1140]MDN8593950.1 ACT domain-containing protein [Corynebacterium sp. P4_F2]WKK56049.1 ACT domain-containing protein [Corynebacterium sp. P4-C1]WKK63459.1 ACT domain-containing protein [Corynebacterium sp. P8-C1]